jgi:hypothetical protein
MITRKESKHSLKNGRRFSKANDLRLLVKMLPGRYRFAGIKDSIDGETTSAGGLTFHVRKLEDVTATYLILRSVIPDA